VDQSSFVIRQSSFVLRSAFVRGLDRTGTADTHASGMTAAQIAMVDVIIPLKNRMKGTRFCKGFFPDKPGTICLRIRLVIIHAQHPFALNTDHRFARTGPQIIFEYFDGRSIRVGHSQMLDRADHFAETTAAAFFSINF
jgi:hypothetical protein